MPGPATTSTEEVPTSPSATLHLRRPDDGSVVLTLSGRAGRDDAAVLSRCVHRELDAHPALMVLELRHERPGPECLDEVVRVARERARDEGIGLRVLTRHAGCDHDVEVPEPA